MWNYVHEFGPWALDEMGIYQPDVNDYNIQNRLVGVWDDEVDDDVEPQSFDDATKGKDGFAQTDTHLFVKSMGGIRVFVKVSGA